MNNDESKPATLDDVVAVLQQHQEILEDIATWIKIGNYENIKKILDSTLKTPEDKIVYNLSDGKNIREINNICGVSIGTVSKHWNIWYKLGLMKTVDVKRGERFIKKFNLEDFEIKIPEIAKQNATTENLMIEQPKTEDQPNAL